MQIDKKTIRKFFWVAVGAIFVYWALHETERFKLLWSDITGIVAPFVIGAVLATLLAHVIQFALHYFSAKYIIKGSEYPFPFKFYAPFAIVLVGVGILCYCMDARMAICRWLAGAALGVWEFLRVYKRKSIF